MYIYRCLSNNAIYMYMHTSHAQLISYTVRQKRKGASEVRWLKTVLSSGTLSDKMAALILLVQVSSLNFTDNTTPCYVHVHVACVHAAELK